MLKKIKKKIISICKYLGFKILLPIYYKFCSLRKVDNKLVLFADHRDRKMADNFISLYDMCSKNGYKCVVLSGDVFGKKVPKSKRRIKKIKYMFRFMKLYAQCRALFLVDYFPLAYLVKPRKGTDVIQLWHACGLMKEFSYAVSGTSWGRSEKDMKRYPMHTTYTLATASSPKVCIGYQKAYKCDKSIIKPLGSPRTDIYFDEKFKTEAKARVRKLFPNIGDRKIILYAPTYRGKSLNKSYVNCELDFETLKNKLSDKYIFLTKFHPLMAKKGFKESGRLIAPDFLYDVTEILTPEEALCAADVLITDYSSILFEYLLLEKPMISYVYDIDDYISDRGLFYPYDELTPGPYVINQKQLIEKLLTVDKWFDIERTRKYKEEYMSACDGHSTERIYKYIFENKKR